MGFLTKGVAVCRKVEAGALYALVVFPPLAAGATFLWSFYVTVWLTALGLSAMLLRRITEARSALPNTNLTIPLLLFIALAVVSLIVSIYPHATWYALIRLLIYLAAMFLAADIARHRRRTRRFIWVLMATSVLLVVIGLIKYSGGPIPSFWEYNVPHQQSFLTSTFFNHNHLSGYLEMAMPLILCVLVISRPKKRRGLWFLALIILVLGVVLAMSRGGWVSLVAALTFCMLFIWINQYWSWARMLMTGVAGALMILIVFMASTPALDRLESTEDLSEPSIQVRAHIWEATGTLIKDKPILGWGLGTYPWSFPQARPLGLAGRVREAHCDYLQLVASMGVLVLIPLLWGAGATFYRGTKIFLNSRSSFKQGVSLGAMGAIVAMLVHSLVDFNIQITSNGLLFFMMVGLVMGVQRQNHVRPIVFEAQENDEGDSSTEATFTPAQAQKRMSLFKYLGLGFALFLVAAALILGRLTTADVEALRGYQKLAAGSPSEAIPLFKTAIDLSSSTPYYYYGFSKSSVELLPKLKNKEDVVFNLNSAEWSTRTALDLNPLEGNLWYQLAELLWMAGSAEGLKRPAPSVLEQLKNALKLDPNNGKFLLAMVRYYVASGEVEKSLPYMTRLAAANPLAYKSLEHLKAWKQALRQAFKQGLMIALDNSNPLVWRQARRSLVRLERMDGNYKAAAEYMGQVVESRGKSIDKSLLLDYGSILLKADKDKEVMKVFSRALSGSQNMAKELEKVRWRFETAKRLDLYEELIMRHTQANPVLAHWRGIQLGKIYLQQGRWHDAEAQFTKALEANEDAEAHAGLSEAYFNLKKWDAAELHAAKALLRDTKNSWYHFLLARALLSQQKYEAALSAIEGAISLTRSWKDFYFNLRGLIHTGQKRYLEALKDWELALAIKPSNTRYMVQLGNTYERLGMGAKARQYFQMAKKKKQAAPQNQEKK